MHKLLQPAVFLILLTLIFSESTAQVRFYCQYRGIPYYKGGASDFSVLSGVKIDPNKEIVLGIGLTGTFTPKELEGELKFNKSSFSVGFNYYLSRKVYVGVDVALNQLRDMIRENAFNDKTLTGEFFLDYQFNVTLVVLRRLHFSVATGLTDLTKLAVKTASDIVEEQKLIPDLALSLRVYVFQIKF